MGYISGNVAFYDTSINQSTDPTAIVGLPAFFDTASNQGVITSGLFSGSASNAGEVQTEATFAGFAVNSGIVEVGIFSETAGNLGVISGSGSFVGAAVNSGSATIAEFCGSASNVGIISNVAIFNDTASNVGTVATATFSESSVNAGTVSGSGLFIGNASNSGTAAIADFNGSASNVGTVITASFNDTASNIGVISGCAAFVGNSSNNGTVQAATFSESALNSGSVSVAVFSGNATNVGTINDTASFFGTASNSGIVQVAVFNEGAINLGVISGSGLFFGTAVNSGVISGDAIFADTAANNGSVEGNANFSATASNEGGTVIGITGSFVRNGALSNGYYLNDAINTDYNSSVPLSALDNNIWYMYSNGIPTIATGAYSSYYFTNGLVAFNYNSLVPRTAQDNNLYYTYSAGSASFANGAYSVGYYATGEIEGGFNSAVPIDTIDSNYYTFSNGIASVATGAYSNGYYLNGNINTAYTQTGVLAQDNNLYYNYVSGVASLANDWYGDTSSAERTVTLNGTVTQNNEGNGILSAELGSDGYLTTTLNDDLGSGDFTIEAFIKSSSFTNGYLVDSRSGSSWAVGWGIDGTSDGKLSFYENGTFIKSSVALTNSEWSHVAFVRNAGTISVYLNGVSVASASNSTNFNGTSTLTIGAEYFNHSTKLIGKISALRIVKGSALYTDNFAIPTSLPTAVTGTELLLNFGATAVPYVPNWYEDTSTIINSANLNGDIIRSDEGSGVLAAEFNGSSSLSIIYADNSEFDFGNEDFTIEMFVKPFDTNSGEAALVTTAQPTDAQGLLFGVYTDANGQNIYDLLGNGSWQYAFGEPYGTNATNFPTYSVNVWQHIAWVRSGNTFTLYKNGVSVKSYSASVTLTNTNNTLHVGGRAIAGSYFKGRIAGLRMVKGSALYTNNFTTPTTLPTNVSGTVLLLNFGATAAPVAVNWFRDSSSYNRIINKSTTGTINQGNDGNGLRYAHFTSYNSVYNEDFTFSLTENEKITTQDFTIEFFANQTSQLGGYNRFISLYNSITSYNEALLLNPGHSSFSNSVYSFELYYNSNSVSSLSNESISYNEWKHYAMVKDGSYLKLFINGILQSSATINLTSAFNGFIYAQVGNFYGKMAGFRIVVGSALYTSNFTVPTSLPTDINGTIVLLNFEATSAPTVAPVQLNGAYSNGYFVNNQIDTNYTSSVPQVATDNGCYYTYSQGVASVANAAYSDYNYLNGVRQTTSCIYTSALVDNNCYPWIYAACGCGVNPCTYGFINGSFDCSCRLCSYSSSCTSSNYNCYNYSYCQVLCYNLPKINQQYYFSLLNNPSSYSLLFEQCGCGGDETCTPLYDEYQMQTGYTSVTNSCYYYNYADFRFLNGDLSCLYIYSCSVENGIVTFNTCIGYNDMSYMTTYLAYFAGTTCIF